MCESQNKPRIEERLDQVEAKLIGLEQRPDSVARVWLIRKQWPKGDPRRRAAWKALLRTWLGPATVGGLLVAIPSLGLQGWQGWTAFEQAEAAETQAAIATEHATLALEEVKARLMKVLWGRKDTGEPVENSTSRQEALLRFLKIERKLLDDGDSDGGEIDLRNAVLSEITLPGRAFAAFGRISFYEADLRGAEFTGATFGKVRFTGAKVSKTTDFGGADLRKCDLSRLDLSKIKLSGTRLVGAWVTQEQIAWLTKHHFCTKMVWCEETDNERWRIVSQPPLQAE